MIRIILISHIIVTTILCQQQRDTIEDVYVTERFIECIEETLDYTPTLIDDKYEIMEEE